MTKIPQETKDRWLPLLRGGELKQSTGRLFDGFGYCCLGVYAKACGATFVPEIESTEDDDDDDGGNVIETESGEYAVEVPDGAYVTNVNESELLEQEWADRQGITKEVQRLLSSMNDGLAIHLADNDPLADVARKHAVGMEARDHYHGVGNTIGAAQGYVPGTLFKFDRMDFAAIAKVIEEDL